jgi:NitT/TauT family transport system ATP-binding protein
VDPGGKGARIDVVGVSKRYSSSNQAEVSALENISFSVEGNEFLAIIGPSGCGKSTLLGIIAGYLQATDGAVRVDHQKVVGPHPDRTVVFQDYALFPWMTVGRNIQSALEARAIPRSAWAELTREYLGLVHLEHAIDRYPFELSGGMKQRVAIARALAINPKIILMDEPFGSLDSQTRYLMQEEILGIWEKTQKTVVLVTHSIDEAVFLSDRVIVMTSVPGRVKETVPIPLDRPRQPELRLASRFQELVASLWQSLRQEVQW